MILRACQFSSVHRWMAVGSTLLALAACTPPAEELNDDDLKLTVPSDDLVGMSDRGEQIVLAKAPSLAARPAPRLPAPAKLQLENPLSYEGGSFGTIGSAKAFVAPLSSVTDEHRLYWVMVKVLSEKYSCFMQAKHNAGPRLLVRCTDGRRVMFWRERGPDFLQFHARQYDQEGYEIVVRQHRMVRVAAQRSQLPYLVKTDI